MSKQRNQANRKKSRRRKRPDPKTVNREGNVSKIAAKSSRPKRSVLPTAAPVGSVVHPVALTDDTPIEERDEAPGLPLQEDTETIETLSNAESDADCADDEFPDEDEEGSMSLIRHLEELRSRIIKSLLAVALGSAVSYYHMDEIMRYVTMPSGKLYYLQPAEAFFTYIKIALFAGFLLALPVVFYQIWRFVLPALTAREKMVIALLVPASVFLFFAGLAFSFFLVLPAAMEFFVGFSTAELQPMFSLHQYFSFVVSFILPFGAVFELPLVILVMAKLGLMSSDFLKKKQRIVLFLSFVVGAVVSPTPDIFTQSMIAIPLFLLYECSYLIVRFILHK